MLSQFRSVAQSLASKVLLGALILTFAVWGIGDMVRPPGRSQPLATVGPATVTLEAYHQAFSRESEGLRRQLGQDFSPETLKALGLPRQVLQRLINRTLIGLESQALGIVPGDALLARRIQENPAFHNEQGHFDKERFLAALQRAGFTEKSYLTQLRQQLASSLLLDSLAAGAPVHPEAVRVMLAAKLEQRSLVLYSLDESAVAPVQPKEDELEAFYTTNRASFHVPEYRRISYVTLSAADVQTGITVSSEDIESAYRERQEEFKHDERRNVDQWVFDSQDKARQGLADLASGKRAAGGVYTSLGAVERGKIITQAEEPVFSARVGEYAGPVQTAFGWHVFHVQSLEPAGTAPLSEVHALLEKDVLERKTEEAFTAFTRTLEDAIAGGSTLAEAAQAMGLKLTVLPAIDAEGKTQEGKPLKELHELDKFLPTAFKADDKEESSLIAAKKGHYYMLRVDAVIPEHARPLEEIKAQVAAAWQAQQRQTKLSQLASEAAAAFAKEETRQAAVERYHLSVLASGTAKREDEKLAGVALPAGLLQEAFTKPIGAGTGAYAQNGGYRIARVKDILHATLPPADSEPMVAMRHALEGEVKNELIEQYMGHLAEKYPVSVDEAALAAAVQ